MKLTTLFIASALVLVGCASKNDGADALPEGSIDSSSSQLVDDGTETQATDDDVESGVEEPLSGALLADPGTPATGADQDALLAKVKANIGKWFMPAGCIATTWNANVATHVFSGCTGPYGMVNFDGTVTTTYAFDGTTLTITYEANGFKANGAEIAGKRVVTYTIDSAGIVTKHRTGNWSGTTKSGKAFTHTADFTVTWDPSSKCITRDGSADSTIATRDVSWSIDGYKRCGLGDLGCPASGSITLERTKGDKSAAVTLEFLGGRDYTVTGPKGNSVTESLTCVP